MIVPLIHMSKKYKATPFTLNKYIGGRLTNIDTFCTACDDKLKQDADWFINKTIQSLDETSYPKRGCSSIETYGFAFVGLGEILKEPVIVKVMLNNPQGRREVKIQRFFKAHRHRNIVQGICEFKCLDNPIKWKNDITRPTQLCNSDTLSTTEFFIIIQEYIIGGDLDHFFTNSEVSYVQWQSLFLQTLFGVLELFEKYGFFYDDWKLRNILLDNTSKKTITYNSFGNKWIVQNTFGITPVFTDFSLCTFVDKTPENLAYQLSFCLDTFGRVCPDKHINKICMEMAMVVENLTAFETIIEFCQNIVTVIQKQ